MQLYTWDELYERADGAGCGDPELRAKDQARYELTEIIKETCGYDIDDCEIPEAEIDWFLEESDQKYLFNEDGYLQKVVNKSKTYRVNLIMSDVYTIHADSPEAAEKEAREKLGCDYLIDDVQITEISDDHADS